MRLRRWALVVGALLAIIIQDVKGSVGKDVSESYRISKPFRRSPRAVCSSHLSITPLNDDIYWRVGNVEKARCSLQGNDNSITSQNLTMFKDTTVLDHKVVDSRSVEVTLDLNRPEEYRLKCSDGDRGFCMALVRVGYEPLPLENLQCVSYNWEVFTCNWTLPYNPVQVATNEYLPYLVRINDPSNAYKCDCGDDYYDLPVDTCTCSDTCCTWSGTSYFSIDRELEVMFQAQNDLGAANYSYIIDNYAVVLPSATSSASVSLMEGLRQAVVSWTLPSPLGTFSQLPGAGIIARVDYKLRQDNEEQWIAGTPIPCHGKTCKYGQHNITLPYWWQTYDVRVRLRSAAAPHDGDDDDGWWSSWHPYNITTPSNRPSSPPVVGVGTFQVMSGAFNGVFDLTLTWQQVPPLLHNGSHFHYLAQLCDILHLLPPAAAAANTHTTNTSRCSEVSVSDSFAVFRNLSISSHYWVRVSAVNSEGVGPWSWGVYVDPDRPVLLTLAVVVEHITEGFETLYEVMWTPRRATNITLYLCVGQHQQQRGGGGGGGSNPCKGDLYWVSRVVSSNTSSVNVTLADFGIEGETPQDAELTFGLSQEKIVTDGDDGDGGVVFSSGLCWDQCGSPRPYSNTPAPPSVTKLTTGSVWVEVDWSLECEYWAGVVKGVEATYCTGKHTHPNNCTTGGDVVMMTFGDDDWSDDVMTVNGLNEGTHYTLWLKMYYRNTLSQWSQPVTFKTNTAGVEAWVVVVVVTVGVVATVLILLILTYSKKMFVDNLKKFRVKPSLPSGLVPEYESGGGCRGRESEGFGRVMEGEGRNIPVSQVSGFVKGPGYGHFLPGIFPMRGSSSEVAERYNREDRDATNTQSLNQEVYSSSYTCHKQGRLNINKQSVSSSNNTEDVKGNQNSSSPSEPLLPSSPTTNYVTPFFYDSEGEACDTPSRPLFGSGLMHAGSSGSGGGGRHVENGWIGSGSREFENSGSSGKNVENGSSSSGGAIVKNSCRNVENVSSNDRNAENGGRNVENSSNNVGNSNNIGSNIKNGCSGGYVQSDFFDNNKVTVFAGSGYVGLDHGYDTQPGPHKQSIQAAPKYDNPHYMYDTPSEMDKQMMQASSGYVSLNDYYDTPPKQPGYVQTDAFSDAILTPEVTSISNPVKKEKYVDLDFGNAFSSETPYSSSPVENEKYLSLNFANDVTASQNINKDLRYVNKDQVTCKKDSDMLLDHTMVLEDPKNWQEDGNKREDCLKMKGCINKEGDFNKESDVRKKDDGKKNEDVIVKMKEENGEKKDAGEMRDVKNEGDVKTTEKDAKKDVVGKENDGKGIEGNGKGKLEYSNREVVKSNYISQLDAQMNMNFKDKSEMQTQVKEVTENSKNPFHSPNYSITEGYIALLPLNMSQGMKNIKARRNVDEIHKEKVKLQKGIDKIFNSSKNTPTDGYTTIMSVNLPQTEENTRSKMAQVLYEPKEKLQKENDHKILNMTKDALTTGYMAVMSVNLPQTEENTKSKIKSKVEVCEEVKSGKENNKMTFDLPKDTLTKGYIALTSFNLPQTEENTNQLNTETEA